MNREYLTQLAVKYERIGNTLSNKAAGPMFYALANDYRMMGVFIKDGLCGEINIREFVDQARKPWDGYIIFREKRIATMHVQLRAIERGL